MTSKDGWQEGWQEGLGMLFGFSFSVAFACHMLTAADPPDSLHTALHSRTESVFVSGERRQSAQLPTPVSVRVGVVFLCHTSSKQCTCSTRVERGRSMLVVQMSDCL